jgi:hypothetical protein
MIDSLGKRYGMLPSEVLLRSNTFDLYIMDASMSFENYHHKKSMNNGMEPAVDYSTDELLQMMAKARGQ